MSDLTLQLNCAGDDGFSLALECQIRLRGVTAIYGASGSGKTTLLDCIAGLRAPSAGSHIQCGDDIWHSDQRSTPAWERQVGYVFHDARLFPHLTVQENLNFALNRQRTTSDISLNDAISWLQLDDLLARYPDTLSAGQTQRVAIARALLTAPRLLLLDEPLANLDAQARQQILLCLQTVSKNFALPIIFVSHNIEEVCQLADQILLLDKGRVVDQGSLLELSSQLDTRLSHEEQAAAIVTAKVANQDTAFSLTQLDVEGSTLYVNQINQPQGHSCRVRIPARDISLCKEQPRETSILNILPVTVEEIENSHTARVMVRLSLGSQFLLARITRKSAVELRLQPGDKLYAQIKSAALLMDYPEQL